jgi:nitrous oxide reductase accessory protein NosL
VRRIAAVALLLLALPAAPAAAASPAPFVKPGAAERCPVCGMFVEKFPAWWAQAVFASGGRVTFDGVNDLVRFLGDPGRYSPGQSAASIAQVWVLDYYSLKPLPAETAFFVAGGDVPGPMGPEFIPFRTLPEAEEFQRDHHGAAILRFKDLPGHRLK